MLVQWHVQNFLNQGGDECRTFFGDENIFFKLKFIILFYFYKATVNMTVLKAYAIGNFIKS